MYPVESFHDDAEREVQQDQVCERDEMSQKRYRSERRDRSFVRRALRRGVPVQEIEDRLLGTTEFHRLNPERDPVAYVRGLIDEEGSSLRNPEISRGRSEEMAGPLSNSGRTSRNGQAIQSEHVARRYIQENFDPADWLAIVVRNRDTDETVQRITTAQQIASQEFQSWLRYKNARGSDIYLSLNTLKEHAHGRTKGDLKEIRHLYLDLDKEGQRRLAAVYEDPAVPEPNYVLQTSPDKYQVVWRVEGIAQNEAEELLRGLARRFGGDPAATDATRVFRLPGFNNKKYEQDFVVRIAASASPEPVHHRVDFKIQGVSEHPGSAVRASLGRDGLHRQTANTQSERDWSYAIRHLEQGAKPEEIVRDIAAYRSTDRYDPQDHARVTAPRKPNPRYYAEHTVSRAMAHLGMNSGSSGQAFDPRLDGSPEPEPDR